MKNMYVPLSLTKWSQTKATLLELLPVSGPGIGFLPVYENTDDLKKDYPTSDYFEIKVKEDI